MKSLLTLLFVAIALIDVRAKEPHLTPGQVKQIVALVVTQARITPKECSEPRYLDETQDWTNHTLTNLIHGETYIDVRDSDGAYRVWTQSRMRMPQYRVHPKLKGAIQKIVPTSRQ